MQVGLYHQAEFAADLAQVHRGEGVDEYRDPRSFFARTYITEGIRDLLATSLRRLGEGGGDPVVELQTNFGGGKTHSMLALYHAFSGVPSHGAPGVGRRGGARRRGEADQGEPGSPRRDRHVARPGAGEGRRTKVHTLWGEMAWQLLGARVTRLSRRRTSKGVSPGSGALRTLFDKAAPCIVLIDEWVAFLRNMYKVDGLPSGTFESNLTFAQALTEAAEAADRGSGRGDHSGVNIEIGGEGGQRRCGGSSNVLSPGVGLAAREHRGELRDRSPSAVPAYPEAEAYPARDAVVKASLTYYRAQSDEFPRHAAKRSTGGASSGLSDPPRTLRPAVRHWCALDKFQRTRGVLRLMAAVIHGLWEQGGPESRDPARPASRSTAARFSSSCEVPARRTGRP